MRVAILTDFISHDPAYSLCGVVGNQVKMIVRGGYECRVIVRPGFNASAYPGAEVVQVNPGQYGENEVIVTSDSETEIAYLKNQISDALDGVDVILTHDLIYQPAQWKYHVAARRVAKDKPGLRWLHWVHSATPFNVAGKTKQFSNELAGKFPNARIVAMHQEEFDRKRDIFHFENDEVAIIPNPLDIAEDYHPAAQEAIDGLWAADIVAVFPCRLDRGKQPHIIIEIFGRLQAMGYYAPVIICDFHSVAGGKDTYRNEIKRTAKKLNVPTLFTSDLQFPDAEYHLPHKAIMDLFDFGDILIHPSMSECDPLILPEAAWKRMGLVLNYDLPYFRLYQGNALLYKFSSCIDVNTGRAGETKTKYDNRQDYMQMVAGGIAYIMQNNPILSLHAQMRKTRSLKVVWERHLWPAIESI